MPHQRKPPTKNRLPLFLAMGGVLLLAIIAIVATQGGSGDGNGDDGGAAAAADEMRPVRVTGEALPRLSPDTDPGVGREAPRVEGAAFDGSPVTIGAGVGAPQLVMVVAHWCPHCQKEVPRITEWLRDKGAPEGVELRGLSVSANPDAPNYPPSEWLDEEGWTIPTIADDEDGSAAAALGVSAYPFFVAIDGSGKVVARTSGELTTEEVERLVQAARTGRA